MRIAGTVGIVAGAWCAASVATAALWSLCARGLEAAADGAVDGAAVRVEPVAASPRGPAHRGTGFRRSIASRQGDCSSVAHRSARRRRGCVARP